VCVCGCVCARVCAATLRVRGKGHHLEVRLEVREPAACKVYERPRIHRRLEFCRYYLRIAARTGDIPSGAITGETVPPLVLSFRSDLI
jgi:ribosomal protein S14